MAKAINYEKTEGERLSDELTYKPQSVWETTDKQKEINTFCKDYIKFLNNAKTERLAVIEGIKILEKAGFKPIDSFKKLTIPEYNAFCTFLSSVKEQAYKIQSVLVKSDLLSNGTLKCFFFDK